MKLSELLTASKQIIIDKGWCTGSTVNAKGQHCALGAIISPDAFISRSDMLATEQQVLALYTVLKKRWEAGTLPAATYAGGMDKPYPWAQLFPKVISPLQQEYYSAIAQFNNSTSEKDVLALFDEAIAMAEHDEQQPERIKETVRSLIETPVLEDA